MKSSLVVLHLFSKFYLWALVFVGCKYPLVVFVFLFENFTCYVFFKGVALFSIWSISLSTFSFSILKSVNIIIGCYWWDSCWALKCYGYSGYDGIEADYSSYTSPSPWSKNFSTVFLDKSLIKSCWLFFFSFLIFWFESFYISSNWAAKLAVKFTTLQLSLGVSTGLN